MVSSIIFFLKNNWKKIFFLLLLLASLTFTVRFCTSLSTNRVWVFGDPNKVTIKVK